MPTRRHLTPLTLLLILAAVAVMIIVPSAAGTLAQDPPAQPVQPAQPDPAAQPDPPAQPDEPAKPSEEEEKAYQSFRAQLHAINRVSQPAPEDLQKLIDLATAFVEKFPTASMVRRTSCALVAAQSLARLEQHAGVITACDAALAFVEDGYTKQQLQELKGMAQLWLGKTGDAETTLAAMNGASQNLRDSIGFAKAIASSAGRQAASDFRLKDVTNPINEVTLSSFKGRVVIVDFWATWCTPCLRLMDQYLKDVDKTWSPRGLTLISVGTKFRGETAEKQAAVAERGEFKWLKVFDPDAAVSNAWNVKTIPHLVLIDKEGKVVLAGNGFVAMPFVKKFLDKECPPKPKDE